MTSTRNETGAGGYLKRLFLGRAIASSKAEHQLLPKILALPVFSSDPLSSVAYATEEMMLVLILAGTGALSYKIPLSLAIGALLVIVVTSYRQTVKAYPRGGGSYIVAKENLGTLPGLIAAAAILTDYVLTVAVSVTAGTIAITSAAPGLADHRVLMAVGLVLLLTLANLRGVKEAGTLFAIPTYGFVVIVGITLVVGLAECISGCPQAPTANLAIEAEVDAVLVPSPPRVRVGGHRPHRRRGDRRRGAGLPEAPGQERRGDPFGHGRSGGVDVPWDNAPGWVVQRPGRRADRGDQFGALPDRRDGLRPGVRVHTSSGLHGGHPGPGGEHGVPGLPSALLDLARDRFMPSQFRNRGDRLVFSNGVLMLAGFACLLIWLFDAQLTHLIQLYVIGVFTAFTLSQSGMVRRWFKTRGDKWRRRAVINGIGAVTTGVVLIIVTLTKFTKGAWIVIAAMPIIVLFFLSVYRHYARVGARLRAGKLLGTQQARSTFFLLVPDLGPATLEAIGYLRAIRPERLEALFVGPPGEFVRTAERWAEVAPRLGELQMLEGADRQLVRAVRGLVRSRPREPEEYFAVVIPEVLRDQSWWQFLRHRGTLLLKGSLLFETGVVVTDVPFVEGQERLEAPTRPVEPERSVVLIPVSAVHDAVVRAVTYAKSLHPTIVEGVYFVTDPEEVQGVIDAWHERQMDVPLLIEEAPFRDIDEPLLAAVRAHTGRGDTVVTVVLPELVPTHWWENLLHNQTAFALKRMLLFEPMVVVTSVPFHLREPEIPQPETTPAKG